MSKSLAAFTPLPGFDGLYSARKGDLRCTAIRLRSGGLCLYSPVAGLENVALQSLADIGPVTHLLAPNHYHNKGLAAHRDAFPYATLSCPAAAQPRLIKQTGLDFADLSALTSDLPERTQIIDTQGLKTGEVWIEVDGNYGCLWIVTDAFRGPKSDNGLTDGQPELLGTFPKFGIADRQAYVAWLSETAATSKPTTLVPCHGAVVSRANLHVDLIGLLRG
ncbi:MAG: hypothetical protein AAFQ64_10180 [Pseudomonadota bacterium]